MVYRETCNRGYNGMEFPRGAVWKKVRRCPGENGGGVAKVKKKKKKEERKNVHSQIKSEFLTKKTEYIKHIRLTRVSLQQYTSLATFTHT